MAFNRKEACTVTKAEQLTNKQTTPISILVLNFIIHIFQKYFVFLKAGTAKIDIFQHKVW